MSNIDIDLFEIIPQRPPMVMIDGIVSCDETTTVTRFTVCPDCIFVENNHLTAEGMLENIAQTCAARIGYFNHCAGHTLKIGFIGAVKSFVLSQRPQINETVETLITVREEIFGITLVDASITLNGNEIASTTMKIALSDIDATE